MFKQFESEKTPIIIAATILTFGLIISAGLGSYTFYKVRSFDNTFQVTGSAKKQITSDVVKWTAQFTRNVPFAELKNGYQQMSGDLKKVLAFYKSKGIQDNALTISPVMQSDIVNYNDPNAPRTYNLTQTVQLQSSDVVGVTTLAKNTESLINEGVIFSTQFLEYYYSKLPDLRVDLLGQAVQDAKARAEKIAGSGGQRVGSLKSASVGVVQVLPVNSVDISDYGQYDTANINKEVMVTVKAAFTVN